MKRIAIVAGLTAIAASALAGPVPVTDTTKRPYKTSKTYCNDAKFRAASDGENIACYNHDACYADPRGKSRKDCDEAYLRDMKLAGVSTAMAYIRFKAVRNWGQRSWNRSREKDRRQAASE